MTKTSSSGDFSSSAYLSNGPQYTVGYDSRHLKIVERHSVADLFARYHGTLWEEGSHKYNVTSFLSEINLILRGATFSAFSQEMLDGIIEALRVRGNSNATINRKIAALSKLLRKAYKMGDIHSLPEFRRQKE